MTRSTLPSSVASSDCPQASRLDAYFDHELPDAEHSAIESHLSNCDPCRNALEQVAAASALMKGIEFPALSQMSRARLERSVIAPARDRWILPIRLLTAAAAAIFLLVSGLIAYQLHHSGAAAPSGNTHFVGTHHISPGSAHVLPADSTHPAQP